jgi:hypothetical protein
MSVTSVAYFKGGRSDEMISAARKAKAILTKHGATNFQLGRVHTGPETGQWAAVSMFANWEEYGRAQAALANDAEYQALFAQVAAVAELTSRRIVAGIDL